MLFDNFIRRSFVDTTKIMVDLFITMPCIIIKKGNPSAYSCLHGKQQQQKKQEPENG
jgi:hypothetical protein